MDDVVRACSWLLERQLVEVDHMNTSSVELDDSIKVTASGFIHLRILCERLEYVYGVLASTPMSDRRVADKLADYVSRESQQDRISSHQMAAAVEEFLKCLRKRHASLAKAYPTFGDPNTGSNFVLSQIESALNFFKNPTFRRQGNVLDD